MVSTNTFVVVGFALLFFSIGANWVYVQADGFGFGYNVLDLANHVLAFAVSNYAPTNTTVGEEIWFVFLPYLVSTAPLLAAEWAFPVSFFLGFVSFFRWRLMIVSGVAAVVSGVLWILGIESVTSAFEAQLNNYPGFLGQVRTSTIDPQLGAYMAIIGGATLILGYLVRVLNRFDMSSRRAPSTIDRLKC